MLVPPCNIGGDATTGVGAGGACGDATIIFDGVVADIAPLVPVAAAFAAASAKASLSSRS